jgi:hypothetical protein
MSQSTDDLTGQSFEPSAATTAVRQVQARAAGLPGDGDLPVAGRQGRRR